MPIPGQTVDCLWCRSVDGRHIGPPHDQMDTDIDGNPVCPEFESWVAFLRSYTPAKCQIFLPLLNNGSEIEVHSKVYKQLFGINDHMFSLLNHARRSGVPFQTAMLDSRSMNGGHNKLMPVQAGELISVLKKFPF